MNQPDQSSWPIYAKAIAVMAIPEDRGLGDVLHRKFSELGTDAIVAAYKKLGGDCGCNARQDLLNARFPLHPPIDDLANRKTCLACDRIDNGWCSAIEPKQHCSRLARLGKCPLNKFSEKSQ